MRVRVAGVLAALERVPLIQGRPYWERHPLRFLPPPERTKAHRRAGRSAPGGAPIFLSIAAELEFMVFARPAQRVPELLATAGLPKDDDSGNGKPGRLREVWNRGGSQISPRSPLQGWMGLRGGSTGSATRRRRPSDALAGAGKEKRGHALRGHNIRVCTETDLGKRQQLPEPGHDLAGRGPVRLRGIPLAMRFQADTSVAAMRRHLRCPGPSVCR